MKQTLEINTEFNQVFLGGQALDLAPRYVQFFALMGLRFEPGESVPASGQYVSAEEMAGLREFAGELDTVKHTLRRQVRELEKNKRTAELVYSPPGEGRKRWAINPVRIKAVGFDVPRSQVEGWLDRQRKSADPNRLKVSGQLALAEMLLESGQWLKCSQILDELSDPKATLLRVELLERQNQPTQASHLLNQLAQLNDPALEPFLLLQQARRLWRGGALREVLELSQTALRKLGPDEPIRRGQWLLLQGLAQLEGGHPTPATTSFGEALETFTEAKWWWGLYGCYANLGLAHYRQESWPEAKGWFVQALQHCQTLNLSLPDAGVLIYLGKLGLRLGQNEAAEGWFRQALELARRNGWLSEQAEAGCELALLTTDQTLALEVLALEVPHPYKATLSEQLAQLV